MTLVLLARPCAAAVAHGAPASGDIAGMIAIAKPSRAHGATLAGIVAPTPALSRPGGGKRVWWVSTQTVWSGEPQVLLALGSTWHVGRLWLRVLLPIRPDGSSGWIPRNNVVLRSTRYWVEVDKHARLISVYRNGVLARRFAAVIGKPATPTPDGLAAVYERDPQPDPNGFIGSWALPLSSSVAWLAGHVPQGTPVLIRD